MGLASKAEVCGTIDVPKVDESVAVVLTTYNDAAFLREAVSSIIGQKRPADEVIVVDDGSTVSPAPVFADFPQVRLLRKSNGGLSSARNAGLHFASSRYIAFLDADDRLEPNAIEAGLACFAQRPEAAMVYGGHRRIQADGKPLSVDLFQPVGEDPYADLLTGNRIGMHSTALYRREVLLALDGFDEELRRCEDYDLYLRLALSYPIASHPEIIAAIRPRRPRPVILMYHRVAVVQHDPWGLAVDPERFEEQIAYLKRHRTPMSMDELVDRLRSKTLPANAVAVTFDDGYRDNLVNAKPVLARYGVPATLFLTTGFINQTTPFWWDELAILILASTQAMRDQQVLAGDAVTFDWGDAERSDIERGWRVSDGPRTARQSAYLAIWRKLQRATAEDRNVALNTLRRHLGTAHDPLGKPMNSDEIRALLSDGLIELGAHTVTHPALTLLSRLESHREIESSGHRCRELAAKCVNGFAYPYGDMSSEVRCDVARLGFSWACSTEGGFVDGKQPDIYALPRVAVPNAPIRTLAGLVTA